MSGAVTFRGSGGRVRGAGLPGVVLGVGLGGFVDGIVFHQLLQWHHLLTGERGDEPSSTVSGLEANTLADGLFHAASLVVVVAGVVLLWRRLRLGGTSWAGRQLAGAMLAGWGLFNLVEGVVDHLVLELHHVRDDVADPLPWDVGFLVAAAAIVAVGWALTRTPSEG